MSITPPTPRAIGVHGVPKSGKTKFAAGAFTCGLWEPERILYVDNHGSTTAFPDLPQFTRKEPWGVLHLPGEPKAFQEKISLIRSKAARGAERLYDLIILDDWSEFQTLEITQRQAAGGESRTMISWREHGDLMKSIARMLFPRVSGASHLAIFQSDQRPDPTTPKPPPVGGRFTPDDRPTMLRPLLQGAFESFFPYKLDALFHQYMQIKAGGKYEFSMKCTPDSEAYIFNRWLGQWLEQKIPQVIKNPDIKFIFETIENFYPTEGE